MLIFVLRKNITADKTSVRVTCDRSSGSHAHPQNVPMNSLKGTCNNITRAFVWGWGICHKPKHTNKTRAVPGTVHDTGRLLSERGIRDILSQSGRVFYRDDHLGGWTHCHRLLWQRAGRIRVAKVNGLHADPLHDPAKALHPCCLRGTTVTAKERPRTQPT